MIKVLAKCFVTISLIHQLFYISLSLRLQLSFDFLSCRLV